MIEAGAEVLWGGTRARATAIAKVEHFDGCCDQAKAIYEAMAMRDPRYVLSLDGVTDVRERLTKLETMLAPLSECGALIPAEQIENASRINGAATNGPDLLHLVLLVPKK
jgi:hypothetical protein